MSNLGMEIRSVDYEERTVTGVCVPYDEISYLTPNPSGERILRKAFAKSAAQRGDKVFLYRDHDHTRPVGRSLSFADTAEGLIGSFQIRKSTLGDETMVDLREDYLPAMSVGFRPLQSRRARDGATEVVEASLLEVSLVSLPAYDGARVLAVRRAMAPVWSPNPITDADLSPIVPGWVYDLG